MPATVLISEVGPRDGLQSVARCLPLADKLAWVTALHGAGLREIEVGSFVPAARLPQLADTAAVVAHARTLPGLTVMALVPNLHGAQAALDAGVHKLTVPVSASAAHSQANVRRTPAQMVEELRRIAALRAERAPQVGLEVGLSTAFGCTIQGLVPEDAVIALAEQVVAAGADEVGLSDTTGMADPAQVRRLFRRLRAAVGRHAGAAHLHNTRGLGLANCLAAFDVGVTSFDSSQAGLGGCPYAPGASGNVVTEDLVFLFERMGVHTGVDLHRLVAARAVLQRGLPGEPLHGMVPEAGLPPGFVYADGRLPDAAPLRVTAAVEAGGPSAGPPSARGRWPSAGTDSPQGLSVSGSSSPSRPAIPSGDRPTYPSGEGLS